MVVGQNRFVVGRDEKARTQNAELLLQPIASDDPPDKLYREGKRFGVWLEDRASKKFLQGLMDSLGELGHRGLRM